MPAAAISNFEEDCREVVDRMRVALIRLFESVDADPMAPQDVARRFKINKNLSWKVSRILKVTDNFEAIGHMPGSSGMKILSEKMREAGADAEALQGFDQALESFARMVEIHVGDRGTLELVLDALAPNSADRLETSRKLAFRGNSGVWGVQAKTRMTVACMAPNREDDSKIDIVHISGYFGFRRIRSEVRWPLFRVQTWAEDESGAIKKLDTQRRPLEEDNLGPGAIMGEFSSDPLPAIESTHAGPEQRYVLMPGPLGNLGAFDFVFGDVMLGLVSRYRDDANPTGEHATFITAPVENLIFDMIVHRDLEFAMKPTVFTYGKEWVPGISSNKECLPMRDEVTNLSGRPPVVTTPLVPRYREILDRAYKRMGREPSEFRGVRLQTKYPPLDSTVVLRFPLPEPPQ